MEHPLRPRPSERKPPVHMRRTYHFGSLTSFPCDSLAPNPGGISTLQCSINAQILNALAIGPNVPFVILSHDSVLVSHFYSRTASKGKAVEANHHRLYPRVSIPHDSKAWWGRVSNLGLRNACSSSLSTSSSSFFSSSIFFELSMIGSSRPGSFIVAAVVIQDKYVGVLKMQRGLSMYLHGSFEL